MSSKCSARALAPKGSPDYYDRIRRRKRRGVVSGARYEMRTLRQALLKERNIYQTLQGMLNDKDEIGEEDECNRTPSHSLTLTFVLTLSLSVSSLYIVYIWRCAPFFGGVFVQKASSRIHNVHRE